MKFLPSSLLAFLLVLSVACPGTSSGGGEGEGESSEGEGEQVAEGEGDGAEGEGEGGELIGEGEGEEGEGEEGEGEIPPPPEGSCRVTDECGLGESCVSPNDNQVCGVAPPPDQCAANSDCPDDQVCDVLFVCGFTRMCVPACDSTAACSPGETCVAGRCESVSCNDDYLCPIYLQCGPRGGDPLADNESTHDCELIRCNDDNDCDSSICVNGSCAADFGSCQLPRP
jgi:hypothetical protein